MSYMYTMYVYFVYRKAIDLFELIIYPATSLKMFIRFRRSLVEFLGSLIYTIISSAKSDILTTYTHLYSATMSGIMPIVFMYL
jgi:hypothetical protein